MSSMAGVGRCCMVQLDPAKQQQNNYNDENQTQPAARGITPGTAVIPRRQGTHQKQHHQDNQDSSEPTFLLVLKKQAPARCDFGEPSRGPTWLRSGSRSLSTDCGGDVLWDRTGQP